MTDPHSHPDRYRRRRKLLVLLLVVFAAWVAGLLWMYFATVYPVRHPKSVSGPWSVVSSFS